MSVRLSARVGVVLRARVDGFARSRGLTLAHAVRELAILGVGGDDVDAALVREEMDGRREEMREVVERQRPDVEFGRSGGREKGAAPTQIVTVRMPAPWLSKVREVGGLRPAVVAGLRAVGVTGEEGAL